MDAFDPATATALATQILYDIGLGLAGISATIFALVAIGRGRAFLKWRDYVDAGRLR